MTKKEKEQFERHYRGGRHWNRSLMDCGEQRGGRRQRSQKAGDVAVLYRFHEHFLSTCGGSGPVPFRQEIEQNCAKTSRSLVICVPVRMGKGGQGSSGSGAPLKALILLSVKWRHFEGQSSSPPTVPRSRKHQLGLQEAASGKILQNSGHSSMWK